MAPRRVIDFLKWAETYHARLAEYFRDQAAGAAAPNTKQLLSFMAAHQDALRHIIADYERGASAAILETWYKPAPDLSAFKDPYTFGIRPNMTVAEAIDLAVELDKSLVSMYELLIRNAPAQNLRDMLEDLLREERRTEILILRTQPAG